MKARHLLRILFFLILFSIRIPYSLHAEIINRVVAIVDDDVITLFELNQMIRNVTGNTPEDIRAKDEEQFFETRENVLNLMIDDRIAQKKVKELGIMVSQGQIDAEIENIKKNNRMTHEDLLNGLKREGLTYEVFRENLKKDLERQGLINAEVKSKILIREEQIKEYYDQHYDEFKNDEQIHLAGIFLIEKDSTTDENMQTLMEKSQMIINELDTGKDFGELAKRYSDGPGAEEGGDLGTILTAQLDEDLRHIIRGLSEGEVSQPIQRGNGIQIFKLLKRMGGETRSFDEIKDSIYDRLYRDEINKRYLTWIKDLRESTYMKIIL
ncbi:MAG: peptidylprolyl isomerase [Deltaproteobacteria bacterium]|nr:peptidylprolyl isomerase [Deltaproteobacteria bacterium]